MTSFYKIEIAEAALSEKPVLRRLLMYYLYDFTEFDRRDVDERGRFHYKHFDSYWTEPERRAYLLRADGQLAGFALVNRETVSGEDRWALAEFFVMNKYRLQGIGEFFAHRIFDALPGKWEVAQIEAHTGSHIFWRKVIERYTGGDFVACHAEFDEHSGPYQLFESPGKRPG